jgi:DNA-binding beta-propeller fold protein YncE
MRTFTVLLPFAALLSAESWRSGGFLEAPGVTMGAASAVAVAKDGAMFVLHRGEPPVLRFSKDGKYLGGWGAGAFKVAHGLRIDKEGNIWTTDNGSGLVEQFTPDGKPLRKLEGFKSPDDLVFGSNGDIYVADAGAAKIVRHNRGGKVISSWGGSGTKPGEFKTLHGLAIDNQDRVYAADRGNDRVQVFDRDGKFAAEWKGFGNPFGLLFHNGNLLVSDGDAKRITELGPRGDIIETWGNADLLKLPHFMAIGARGQLLVAEVDGKRVQTFLRGGQ